MDLLKSLKGNRIYSILTGACPVCHEVSMYKDDNPYHVSHIFEMYDRCPNCGNRIKFEPSFFFGAMYVSYAVGIAFAVAAFVIAFFVFNLTLLNVFWAIVGTLIIFLPVIVRLSRNIWVNFFFNYDKKHSKH